MKHEALINQMTLEEKVSLMSGENFWNTKAIERLNIPSIMLTDGPHGLRKQAGKADHLGLNKSIPATCFPTAAALANSWDRELIYKVGQALGKEARSEKVSVLLGPGLNIKRNPLCGRNFEYFSEDPYLTGELATAMVQGIQAEGISACPKHFAVNSQEHMRMTIDEVVDERSLREIYLAAFEKVVKEAQPKTLMTSYNQVNGTYANEHPHLVNEILREEWAYDGVIVTDWGGNNDRVAGLKAHNQLEMPSTNGITDKEIQIAVEKGELSEAVLNQAVDELLTLIDAVRLDNQEVASVDLEKHHQQAVQAAEQSIVLLKNENQVLPLTTTESIAVIGDFAQTPRYQGAGSSLVNPYKISTPLENLQQSNLTIVGYERGFKRQGGNSKKLHNQAIELAKKAETILLFLGLDEGREAEGVDRENLKLAQNQIDLLEVCVQLEKKVVVILAGGGPIEIPFIDQIQGIVHTYLAGQGSGEAITRILTGVVNPSGRLNETFPIHYEDVSSSSFYPGKERTSEHREGLFIGYRYFDKVNQAVQFPFGFGLSYTEFAYSDLEVTPNQVTFTLTNTGKRAGAEVPQLYIEKKNSHIFRAKKELKSFDKVFLEPGESTQVHLSFNQRSFAYFSQEQSEWQVEAGEYLLHVGRSVAEIELTTTFIMEGTQSNEYTKEQYPHYFSGEIKQLPTAEFISLLGYQPPDPLWDKDKKLGMNDTIAQVRYKHWLGKGTYNLVAFVKNTFRLMNNPIWSNNMYFILNMPFRQIERFTGGKISDKMVRKYLKIVNRE